MSAATHNREGATASPNLSRGDWLGLALFLAPIAVAAVNWLVGVL